MWFLWVQHELSPVKPLGWFWLAKHRASDTQNGIDKWCKGNFYDFRFRDELTKTEKPGVGRVVNCKHHASDTRKNRTEKCPRRDFFAFRTDGGVNFPTLSRHFPPGIRTLTLFRSFWRSVKKCEKTRSNSHPMHTPATQSVLQRKSLFGFLIEAKRKMCVFVYTNSSSSTKNDSIHAFHSFPNGCSKGPLLV